MLLKRLKIAKLCGYFVIIVAPLPLWHTAKLPLGFPSQRKNKTSVKVSNADVPRHLLKRPVSWLCSPQSGKHFHRGPCWHSSTGVWCGCCWARDALSLSLALNPMRWAFFWAACKRFNPGVATDVRWLRLRLFYVSSCPFCATRRRKTWRGSNLHYFRNESSRDVRTGKETRKLVGVELSVWGDERAAFSTSTRSIEWTSW